MVIDLLMYTDLPSILSHASDTDAWKRKRSEHMVDGPHTHIRSWSPGVVTSGLGRARPLTLGWARRRERHLHMKPNVLRSAAYTYLGGSRQFSGF
jgi:hypothetical protein